MAETQAGAAPQIDKAALEAALAPLVAAALVTALKPIQDAQAELVKNQKVLADTFAADQTAADKAASEAAKKATEKKEDPNAPKALDAAAVTALVAEAIKKDRETTQQTQQQADARKAFISGDKSGLAKIAGNSVGAVLVESKLGSDPTKWEAEAKGIVAAFEKSGIPVADVGGANRDGGTPASKDGKTPVVGNNLPEGTAKFAAGIKLPGAAV